MASINFKIRTHNRISKNLVNSALRKIDNPSGDYIIHETYQDESNTGTMAINISKLLNMDLSLRRYTLFKYGKDAAKKEQSCFKDIKGQSFKIRKADITLLIFDSEKQKMFLVCGDAKKTLKHSNLADAREQLISSYIDLHVFNALLCFNYYPVETIFFVAYEEIRLPKSPLTATAQLGTNSGKNFIPYRLLNEEYESEKLHFNLDDQKLIKTADQDTEKIDTSHMLYAQWKFVQVCTS